MFQSISSNYYAVLDLFITVHAEASQLHLLDRPCPHHHQHQTPLFYAASLGHVSIVRLLVSSARCSPSSPLPTTGATPLYVASKNGHVEVVEFLLHTISTQMQSSQQSAGGVSRLPPSLSSLFAASHGGHIDIVKLLLSFSSPAPPALDFVRPSDGATALIASASCGHAAVVRYLISVGADPRLRKRDGTGPLFAAAQGGHHDVLNTLLSSDCPPRNRLRPDDEVRPTDGCTPLIIASQEGHASCVSVLLRNGASLRPSTSDDGATALSVAVAMGHADVVDVLLRAGADPNATVGVAFLFRGVICPLTIALRLEEKESAAENVNDGTGNRPAADIVRMLVQYGAVQWDARARELGYIYGDPTPNGTYASAPDNRPSLNDLEDGVVKMNISRP